MFLERRECTPSVVVLDEGFEFLGNLGFSGFVFFGSYILYYLVVWL